MAGLALLSTADVMGKATQLRSSEKTRTCLADTPIFLGVSNFFARGKSNKRGEVLKIKITPLKKPNCCGLGAI